MFFAKIRPKTNPKIIEGSTAYQQSPVSSVIWGAKLIPLLYFSALIATSSVAAPSQEEMLELHNSIVRDINKIADNINREREDIAATQKTILAFVAKSDRETTRQIFEKLIKATLYFTASRFVKGEAKLNALEEAIKEVSFATPIAAVKIDIHLAARQAYQNLTIRLNDVKSDAKLLEEQRGYFSELDTLARNFGYKLPSLDIASSNAYSADKAGNDLPITIGLWKIELGDAPSASLPLPPETNSPSGPAFSNLHLTCSRAGGLAYRMVPLKGKPSGDFDILDGENSFEIKAQTDGLLSSTEASKFVLAVKEVTKIFGGGKDTEILVQGKQGTSAARFYGLDEVRNKLKDACLKSTGKKEDVAARPDLPRLSIWHDVQDALYNADQNGACLTRAGKAIFQFRMINCYNSAGTNAIQRNAIFFDFNSGSSTNSLRIDQQDQSRILSSIHFNVPSNIYTSVSEQQVENGIKAALASVGYGEFAQPASAALKSGVNGSSYVNGLITKWIFTNRAYGSIYTSPQNFEYLIINRCGAFEQQQYRCQN